MASGVDVNVLVLNTQVYSNTGGQMSKATPRGARAQFADGGKLAREKDLGMMVMNYGSAYVGSVAMGANDMHTVKTFLEAESYRGPSLIIAFSHCIAQGYDMRKGMDLQAMAVDSGACLLYRYDPRLSAQGKNPLQLDSKPPTVAIKDFCEQQIRFNSLLKAKPEAASKLIELYQKDVNERFQMYQYLAAMGGNGKK
jgi:pyruvate-ferredoxin/flavodoxin oxidoreductase